MLALRCSSPPCTRAWRGALRGGTPWEVVGTQGLLQGCPLSPLALITFISRWHEGVAVPRSLSVSFFDDRTVVILGAGAVDAMAQVLKDTKETDMQLELRLNRAKSKVAVTAGLDASPLGLRWSRAPRSSCCGTASPSSWCWTWKATASPTTSGEGASASATLPTAPATVFFMRGGCCLGKALWAAPIAGVSDAVYATLVREMTACAVPFAHGAERVLVKTAALGPVDPEVAWLHRGVAARGRHVVVMRCCLGDDLPLLVAAMQFAAVAPKFVAHMASLGIDYIPDVWSIRRGGVAELFGYGRHSVATLSRWIEEAITVREVRRDARFG